MKDFCTLRSVQYSLYFLASDLHQKLKLSEYCMYLSVQISLKSSLDPSITSQRLSWVEQWSSCMPCLFIKNLTTEFYWDSPVQAHILMLHCTHEMICRYCKYMAMKKANRYDTPFIQSFLVLSSVSMGQLVVDQFVVGTTGRTALAISLMKPEPHYSSVVFFTCRQLYYGNHGLSSTHSFLKNRSFL